MSIDISLDQIPKIGPGFLVVWTSTFIGPMPSGSFWKVTIRDSTERPVMIHEKPWTFSGQNIFLGAPRAGEFTNTGQSPSAEGAPVSLTVEMYPGGSSTPLESDTVTGLQWDTSLNAWSQVQQATKNATQATLSPELEMAIQTTEDATTQSIQMQTNPLGRVLLGIADLALQMPVNRLSSLECRTFTGRGTLQRPSGVFPVDAFGVSWQLVSVPENFGKRDGALVEYIERLAQLVRINRDTSGVQFVEEVMDIFWDGGKMAWSWNNLPYQILYDVTPGVTMQFCWLLL